MDFHKKLQELRKQRGLTQEELAASLYVSRTAISKWESGRGYPNIDSLKAIAAFYSVSIDTLLSGDEILNLAEDDHRRKHKQLQDLVFGLLDCSMALLFFLPLFGQPLAGRIAAVSLLALTGITPYLKAAYLTVVLGTVATGLLTLALQNCCHRRWLQSKALLSVGCSAAGVLLFIISQQPYAAVLVFVFLIIKTLMLVKPR